MNKLDLYANKLQKIVDDLPNITIVAVEETKQEAIALNKEQMIFGVDSNELDIGSYASSEYRAMKLNQNPFAGGKVDLRLTGAFHRAMFAETSGNLLKIDSNDPKRSKLVEKYSDNIFGLHKRNTEKYKKTVYLYIIKTIKERLK